MSIIYTFIARDKKIILSDYTEYSGNFQQISLIILNKVNKNKKCSLEYNEYENFLKYFFSYNFYYEDERDLTYLCICKNLNEDVAFSFLNDLKKSFLKKYDHNIIQGAYAYQLRDFVEEMKNLIKFYEENPNHSKTTVILNHLNDTAGILRESVEELLDRNEKMNIIAQKSKHLKSTSEDLRIFVNYNLNHSILGIDNKKKRKK